MRVANDRRGFALLAVLWMMVALGVLAVEFHAAARADRHAASNARDAARARWAARAGMERALAQLEVVLRESYGEAFTTDNSEVLQMPLRLSENRVEGEVRIVDARARLNLNLAAEAELSRLMIAVGIPASRAAVLADGILDWRDADAVPRLRGAEADRYRALRPPTRPKDGHFESVQELQQVWGITLDEFRRLARYLSVEGDGRINVNNASLPVLLTLPGVDTHVGRHIVERRRTVPYSNVYELLQHMPALERVRMQDHMAALMERVAFGPRTVEIVANATVPGSPITAELRGVVTLPGGTRISVVRVTER
jgi:type II secretory pathway component PulK